MEAAIYPVSVAAMVAVMGGPQAMHIAGATFSDLQAATAHGLPFVVARNVAEAVAPADSGTRQRVSNLIASPTTVKRGKLLSPAAGEKAERLARNTALANDRLANDRLANDCLGDPAAAREWLTEPHVLFGKAPVEAAATDLGARRVERIPFNIEYSLPL